MEIHYMSISELAWLIRTKKVSPVEVTELILRRIEELDPHYKAYATVMTDHAIIAAKRAEKEIMEGNYKGTLHGVPMAVKDLCFTDGVRTMGGSSVMTDHVPSFDATVVERLKASGSVLLGKLNLTEGAMGGYNPSFDIPLNPWNDDRWAGASSSGSGVSTALGLCYGSLGSDTGGSIRFPAAACGTVGLKPTWGRVSRYGILALAESLDHVGPLTRTAADAGVVLMAIAGQDSKDPTTLSDPVFNLLDEIEKGVEGVRIGIDENYIVNGVDLELSRAVLEAVKILGKLGAEIVDIKMPDLNPYISFWQTLCAAEAVEAHRKFYPSRRDEYGPYFRGWLDIGKKVSGADYAEANNQRNKCNSLLKLVLQEIDVLACPSTIAPAHPITLEEMYGPMDPDRVPGLQRFTVPYNYSGTPTISLPCGFNKDGMPLSIQFVGNPLSEAMLCRIGHTYESATQWHDIHPSA